MKTLAYSPVQSWLCRVVRLGTWTRLGSFAGM
jgi:hypothetical protein